MKKPFYALILYFVFAVLLLSACSGDIDIAPSPEAAAVDTLLQNSATGLTVNQETIAIRQTIEVDNSQSVVALTFQGTRPDIGPVSCFYTYQTLRRFLGWATGNGGGACRADPPDQPLQDLELMGGHYSGQRPQDPGYTQLYGTVHNEAIVKVLVTWADNQRTEVDVVEGTLITLRSGDVAVQKAEALNAEEQIVYTYHHNALP